MLISACLIALWLSSKLMCFLLILWRKVHNYLSACKVGCSLFYFHFLCSDKSRIVTHVKTHL